eukprot:scaffold39661_cov63-Cyclotella_meneghiniana.AAC.20
MPLPPMQTIYVEGLPGTGKTFLINTLSNIVKTVTGSNTSYSASAPTGCAASLTNDSTHCRCMSIPVGVGKKATKETSNVETTNSNRLKHLRKSAPV